MITLYMHQTTYEYIRDNIDAFNLGTTAYISGDKFMLNGVDIKIDNSFCPTINESRDWIFPNERFVTYEKSDEEWCRYFGIGRQGRGFIMGEIFSVDSSKMPIMYPSIIERKGPYYKTFDYRSYTH